MTLAVYDLVEDLSSASEVSERESDEEDADTLSTNTCFDCGATGKCVLFIELLN